MLCISYDQISLRWDLSLLFEEALNLISSAIGGSVIDKDNVIIGIVLHEDRFDVLDVSLVFGIIKSWDNNTKRELVILTHRVFLLIVISLFF